MKISHNWLKELIEIDFSPLCLMNKLTFSGIEVETVISKGAHLDQIKIAEIVDKRRHPEAEKLSICMVYDGENTHQVVCGAPNCAIGQKIAFAPVGAAVLGQKLKKVKLRGVESNGMICSEKELGISDEHDGILVLPREAPTGGSFADFSGKADTIFDLEITPNRPDLLGLLGIARDLAAQMGLKSVNVPYSAETSSINTELSSLDGFSVELREPLACTRYIATRIKNVKVKSSPAWLIEKLVSVDIKPINNIVDITNYVMYLYGHPLHAFDEKHVFGNKIVVRKSFPGEKFPALDHNSYELTGNELVIADVEKAIALAGIIGGTNSHITDDTTDIVLEAACFDSSLTRQTSRHLKIFTDSAYRFERGMVESTCLDVAQYATKLILEIAGGKVIDAPIDEYPAPRKQKVVGLRLQRVKKMLSIDIPVETIKGYLKRLGLEEVSYDSTYATDVSRECTCSPPFVPDSSEELFFKIPDFRTDLVKEVDLIEEIIRLHGFDNIVSSPTPAEIMNMDIFNTKRGIKNVLVNSGFYEAMNISFLDPVMLDMLNLAVDDSRRKTVKIINPQGESYSILRSTLLPGLLKNVLLNLNHGAEYIKLFELNKVFTEHLSDSSAYASESAVSEKWRLTGVVSGRWHSTYWKDRFENVSFYDVKGMFDGSFFGAIGIKEIEIVPSSEPFYLPNSSLFMMHKKNILGSLGKLDKKVLLEFGIECDVYAFDFDLDTIFRLADFQYRKFVELPKYPMVQRDISFIISEEYLIKDVIKTILEVNHKIIKQVLPFDQYKGKQIAEGFRSLSINISLLSEIKTLTDAQIKTIMDLIIERLQKKYKIEMR